ncbi:unnamed protein product [Schistosoma margrebowiei]|uniref:Uncharacterized protein n=1 Tax=Schistosoma margrebowiei TaxID=48269 RepID=A0A183LHS7_9TREM|nr:unnamed protein product [Schistosoma margrebowiei]
MVVGGSRQKSLDPGFMLFGTYQQGVPAILMELVFPDKFNTVACSPNISETHKQFIIIMKKTYHDLIFKSLIVGT